MTEAWPRLQYAGDHLHSDIPSEQDLLCRDLGLVYHGEQTKSALQRLSGAGKRLCNRVGFVGNI